MCFNVEDRQVTDKLKIRIDYFLLLRYQSTGRNQNSPQTSTFEGLQLPC